MRQYLLIFLGCLLFNIAAIAQSAETDAVFDRFNLKFSPEVLRNAKLEYEQANDTIRSIMRQVYSMPMSSRAEMIENYNERSKQIDDLKTEFDQSIPKGYVVNLEIKMDDGPLKSIRSIDMQLFEKNEEGGIDMLAAEWDMKYGSAKLDSMMNIIQWDPMTFSGIKNLMQVANCISIENGNGYTEIGFARSGLGKYSYLIFDQQLDTIDKIKAYNDGCTFLFYKPHVVLKYEGGQAGPQCFTD